MSGKLSSLSWFVLSDKNGLRKWNTHAQHKGDVWINSYIQTGKSCMELIRTGHSIVKTEIVKN